MLPITLMCSEILYLSCACFLRYAYFILTNLSFIISFFNFCPNAFHFMFDKEEFYVPIIVFGSIVLFNTIRTVETLLTRKVECSK